MIQFVDAFERTPTIPGNYFVITELGKEIISSYAFDKYKLKYELFVWIEHDFDTSKKKTDAIQDVFTRTVVKTNNAAEKKKFALEQIKNSYRRKVKDHIGTDVIQSISEGSVITKDQFKKMIDFMGIDKAIRIYRKQLKSSK